MKRADETAKHKSTSHHQRIPDSDRDCTEESKAQAQAPLRCQQDIKRRIIEYRKPATIPSVERQIDTQENVAIFVGGS